MKRPHPRTLVKVGKSYRQTQRIKNNVPFFIIGAEGDHAIQQWILPRLSCAGNLQNVDLVFPNIFKFAGVFCWFWVFCFLLGFWGFGVVVVFVCLGFFCVLGFCLVGWLDFSAELCCPSGITDESAVRVPGSDLKGRGWKSPMFLE